RRDRAGRRRARIGAVGSATALGSRHRGPLQSRRDGRAPRCSGRSSGRSAMRHVLDASVAVAAARPGEPQHRAARNRVEAALDGSDPIVVPVLFEIEVAASLARVGVALSGVRAYVDGLLAAATVVPLGRRAARQVRETAMRWRLRAADAAYVWV